MADSNQNLVQFRLTGTLSVSGTTVNVSNDILRNTAVNVENASITLKNEDGTTFELVKATVTGGVLTTSKRGIKQDKTLTEDATLKREWRPGTIGFVTSFASDLPDLDNTTGVQEFQGDIGVVDGKKLYIGDNAYLTTLNNGTDLQLKDGNNALTTLSVLTAGAGTDHKLKASASDTTAGFLDGKLTAGDGLSKTIINPAGNESIDLDIDLTDTTIFVSTSSGAGDSGKVARLNASGKLPAFINSQADGSATETEAGLVERATDAEVTTGTDTIRYITPKQAKDNYELKTDVLDFAKLTSDASTTETISHGLGKIPKMIQISAGPSTLQANSFGVYANGKNRVRTINNDYAYASDNIFWAGDTGPNTQKGYISAVTSTNFTITYTKTGNPGTVNRYGLITLIG